MNEYMITDEEYIRATVYLKAKYPNPHRFRKMLKAMTTEELDVLFLECGLKMMFSQNTKY